MSKATQCRAGTRSGAGLDLIDRSVHVGQPLFSQNCDFLDLVYGKEFVHKAIVRQ